MNCLRFMDLIALMELCGYLCNFYCGRLGVTGDNARYLLQGMRCPANTHKPSFHVNTSVTSKHNSGRGTSSGHRSGGIPTSDMEDSMTEEEFFEWLQNAMQAGVFDPFGASTSTENPSARPENSSKSGGNNSGSGSANKRKKKGKKQR